MQLWCSHGYRISCHSGLTTAGFQRQPDYDHERTDTEWAPVHFAHAGGCLSHCLALRTQKI